MVLLSGEAIRLTPSGIGIVYRNFLYAHFLSCTRLNLRRIYRIIILSIYSIEMILRIAIINATY